MKSCAFYAAEHAEPLREPVSIRQFRNRNALTQVKTMVDTAPNIPSVGMVRSGDSAARAKEAI